MQWMADQGTLCERAYCASPLCLPSRSAFMAGQWVHRLGTYSNCNAGLEDMRYLSYGQALREQGVQTVHIGKTHVYRPGPELGFGEMLLPGDQAVPGDTNHRRRPLAIRPDAAERAGQYGPHPAPFSRDLEIVDAAITWLTQEAPHLDRPWLLTINLNKPHFPQWVTQELWDLYPQGGDLPEYDDTCASANHPYARDLRAHFQTDQFTEEQIRGLRRGYLGCVTFVDQQLGRLRSTLDQTGALEQTNLIYTSDHGDMLGKFGMWWKCSLYEDSVRVPLLAVGPDFSQRRVQTPVSLLDAQATLFACLGAARPDDWQGQALQNIASRDDDRAVFAEYHGHGVRAAAYMLRQGPWKLMYNVEAPHLLYNLADDPEELTNLAAQHPELVAALEAKLRKICDPEIENARAFRFQEAQLAALGL
jgi:choline-sulfatase